MNKLIGTVLMGDELQKDSFPQIGVNLLLRCSVNDGNHADLGAVSQAGKLLQSLLALAGQAIQLSYHKLYYVVSVTLRVNTIQIPKPSRLVVIEGEQLFLDQRINELDDKEWVTVKRINNQLFQIFASQGRKDNVVYGRSSLANRLQPAPQGVGGVDFIVSIGAD